MRHSILFFIALFFSCTKPSESLRPKILVSLAPYQTIVERIAGERVLVQTIIPIGANPHLYEPNARQIGEISGATLWFRLGESFERKLLPVLQEKSPILDVDLRQKVSLLHHSCCHQGALEDKHIWLSTKELHKQVEVIVEALTQSFPEYREEFAERGKALQEDLAETDQKIQRLIEAKRTSSFLVSHPAFAYFCRDYDLVQISIEEGGKDPTPKYLEAMLQEVQKRKTSLALAMPQHSNKGLEIVAKQLHLHVETIDPYGKDPIKTLEQLATLVASE